MNRPRRSRGSGTTFAVTPLEAGVLLLDLLSQRLRLSRRQAKQVMDERRVFVNGRRVWMARHVVAAGDQMLIKPPAKAPLGEGYLFRDEDYLVVDKPPELLSNGPDSLEEQLRQRFERRALRVAHRLDRDTSGCLLVALHERAYTAAVKMFRDHKVSKRYRVIVAGNPSRDHWAATRPLEGLPARTEFRVLGRGRGVALLEACPVSGRTHQIRLHLQQGGTPVLGDKQYTAGPRSSVAAEDLPSRQMLHAWGLVFTQPLKGGVVSCRAPLPADFRDCLRSLGVRMLPRGRRGEGRKRPT